MAFKLLLESAHSTAVPWLKPKKAISPLPADGKLAAIGGLGGLAGVERNTRDYVRDWTAENPNAAETVEAGFNLAAAAKAAKLAKSAKAGKAGVSGDFSEAY